MSRSPAPDVSEGLTFTTAQTEQIRSELERLVVSPQFRTSKRCQSLLQYVVEQALKGDTGNVKERTLGVAVFGRLPDYDTNQDPVVRTTAGEIRKKLAQYYQEPEHATETRISLLPGSYVPEFVFAEAVEAAPVPATAAKSQRKLLWIGAASLAAAAVVAWWAIRIHGPSVLDRFWSPLLRDNEVVLCLGQPGAYNLRSDKAQDDLLAAFSHGQGVNDPSLKGKSIALKDLVPMTDRYLAYGDAVCLARMASIFDQHGAIYHIRGSAQTSFSELREHPSAFIGAFDNEWTLRFGAGLRFWFFKQYEGTSGQSEMIVDRQHPHRQDWKLVNSWPDWNVPYDYALITRVYNRSTDHVILMAGGITQYGTMAAGDFLASPEYFSEAASKFPRGWEKKNLQIVLRVPVVHGMAAYPAVVATYVW